MKKRAQNKGEIATLLTLASMAIIAAGLLIGTSMQQREAGPTYTPPRADAPTVTAVPSRLRIATEATDDTEQVCFPITHKNSTKIEDPWCNSHMKPVNYGAGSENPQITINSKDILTIEGTFCMNNNLKDPETEPLTIQMLKSRLARVFIGINSALERTDSSNQTIYIPDRLGNLGTAEASKNEFKAVRYNQRTKKFSNLSDTSPLCTYNYQLQGSTKSFNYEHENDVAKFTIRNVSIDSILMGIRDKLELLSGDPTDIPAGLSAENVCTMNIHLTSEGSRRSPFEAYNLAELDMEEILGGDINEADEDACFNNPETDSRKLPTGCYRMKNPKTNQFENHTVAKWIEILCSPKQPAYCAMQCQSDSDCLQGLKPVNGVMPTLDPGIKLECLEVDGMTVDGTDKKAKWTNVKGKCGAGGGSTGSCVCMRDICDEPSNPMKCTEEANACYPPTVITNPPPTTITPPPPTTITPTRTVTPPPPTTITPTRTVTPPPPTITRVQTITPSDTPTETPTETPSVTPTETPKLQTCSFKATSYIDECTEISFVNGAPVCKVEPFDLNKIKGRVIDSTTNTYMYGFTNNKQEISTYRKDIERPVDRPYMGGLSSTLRRATPTPAPNETIIDSKTSGARYVRLPLVSPHGFIPHTVTASQWTFNGQVEDVLSEDITILGSNYPDEVYMNGEIASVKLDIDRSRYGVIPRSLGGVESRNVMCQNSIEEFNRRDAASTTKPCQDIGSDLYRIESLPVRCGEEIEYGWTIVECNTKVDYILALDISTSMNTLSKFENVKDTAKRFVQEIKKTNSDSRVSIVTFNRSVDVSHRRLSSGDDRAFFTNFDEAEIYISNILKTGLDKQGTCIECALDEVHNLVTGRRDTSRTPVVIFLTDGIPTYENPGPAQCNYYNDNDKCGVETAAQKLKSINGIVVASIGYGKPQEEDITFEQQLFEVIRMIGQEDPNDINNSWIFSAAFSQANGMMGINIFRDLNEAFDAILSRFNMCDRINQWAQTVLKSKDINSDGVINSVDYFLVVDSYFEEGDNIDADITSDGIVNSLDLSSVIIDFGKVIEEETQQ